MSTTSPFQRRDVRFDSEGLSCAAWYYAPADAAPGERRAAVVMAHGWSGVKEMYLSSFAEAFAAEGMAVLVFDYRCFGESQGEPRGQIIPGQQRRDYRNAITWLANQPEVDPDRIGIWGTSFSGGHVLVVAAEDRRVKAVVAHVPAVGVRSTTLRWLRRGLYRETLRVGALLVRQWLRPRQVVMVPVVNRPGQAAALPGQEARDWKQRTASLAPNWRNEVTASSLFAAMRDSVRPFIPCIAPTPLLMVVASRDDYCFTDEQLRAFATAGEPKKLVQVDGGHFDFYAGPGLDQVLPAHVEWFKTHLAGPPAFCPPRAE